MNTYRLGINPESGSSNSRGGEMNLLNRMNFSSKLRLMSLAGLVGLGAFAAVAFSTLHAVRINSALYQDIALAYQLAGDCYDPPASLLDALAPAISAEDATTPEETRKFVALVQQAHQSFTAAHKHYQEVLPPGAIRDLMRDESGPTGEEWFAVADSKYLPALLAGDHEAARQIRIAQMDPIFVRHKAANDKLAQLTGDWIPSEEKRAGSIIHARTVELCLIFVAMAVVLWFAGLAISRGIVGPVRQAVHVLSSMASGDLSQSLEVDTADEMREVADAVNRTAGSFRAVLSSPLRPMKPSAVRRITRAKRSNRPPPWKRCPRPSPRSPDRPSRPRNPARRPRMPPSTDTRSSARRSLPSARPPRQLRGRPSRSKPSAPIRKRSDRLSA